MRSRFFAIVAITSLMTVFCLRAHIKVLRDIAHTYSTFYPLLRTNPDLVYKYPTPVDQSTQVPKIIHHIALGSGAKNLTKYQAAMDSCREMHPDWKYNLWTDANATSFMRENYPEIAPHYEGYFQNIQRANVLRYALLHKFGGVYFDIDVTCLVRLEKTPLLGLPFVSPGAHPAGANNAFIAARPGHAFLTYLLNQLPRHDMFWGLPMRLPYIENMLSTGCMYFSNMWMNYAGALVAGYEKEYVHILADKNGDLRPHMLRGVVRTPVMAHGGASSWHGWDAAAILVIGRYYRTVVTGAAVLAVGLTMFVLYRCLGGRLRRRRAWWRSTKV